MACWIECVSVCPHENLLLGSRGNWVPDPLYSRCPPVRLLTQKPFLSIDKMQVCRCLCLCRPLLWNSSLLGFPHEYIFFATAVTFFPPKPWCWLYLFSHTKNTKLFPGNEKPCSLPWCIAFFTETHYKTRVSTSRGANNKNASSSSSSGQSPCKAIAKLQELFRMKIKEAWAHHQSNPNASVNVSNIFSFLSLLFTRMSEVGALKL